MGCGCKNKGNQTPPPQQTPVPNQQAKPVQNLKPTNPTIQESIKKVVEKYYKK